MVREPSPTRKSKLVFEMDVYRGPHSISEVLGTGWVRQDVS